MLEVAEIACRRWNVSPQISGAKENTITEPVVFPKHRGAGPSATRPRRWSTALESMPGEAHRFLDSRK